MANRSDFESVFPRQYKKQMALAEAFGNLKTNQDRSDYKKIMINAHSYHRSFKNKKRIEHVDTSADSSDE